jgi:serpin B
MRTVIFLLPLLTLRAADPTAAGIDRFGADFFKQLAHAPGNVVVSPFSNAAALSMLLEGARGQTAVQLAKVLHQPGGESGQASGVAALLDRLTREANAQGGELLTAQGLWLQRGFHIRTDFEKIMAQQFHASATQLDFAADPEQARIGINSWTSTQTKGKIPELFGPGSLARDVTMVLTSAIYFHGPWQLAFRTESTRPAAFHTGGRETVQAPTMNQTASFAYGETPTMQVLEMKYGKSPLVFDVLLPRSAEDLTKFETSLSPENLEALWGSLADREVAVSLPRFRLDSDISLRDILCNLGVSDAFGSNADFSGIDDRRDLVLSDMRHKAFIEVGEQGTTAAAVTGSTVRLISSTPPPVVFRADHPFLFFIRDPHTGVLLFAGRLVSPVR